MPAAPPAPAARKGAGRNALPRPGRHVVLGRSSRHRRRHLLLPVRARAGHRARPRLPRGLRRRHRDLQEPDRRRCWSSAWSPPSSSTRSTASGSSLVDFWSKGPRYQQQMLWTVMGMWRRHAWPAFLILGHLHATSSGAESMTTSRRPDSPAAVHAPPPLRARTTARRTTELYALALHARCPACPGRPGPRAPVHQPGARTAASPRSTSRFVAGRWASPFWQVWDLLMLWLAMLHGANGAAHDHQRLRRARRHPLVAQGVCCTSRSVFIVVLGTLVIFTFDPCTDPAELPPSVCASQRSTTMQFHKYDVVIVGAGGAGMRAAIESGQRAPHRRADQALPDPVPHRRGAGRHVRRAGQRRGGQLGVAHLRHRSRAATTWSTRTPPRSWRRRPSTRSSTWRRWACRSTARPRARSTSAASAGTPATTARPPCAGPATPPTAPAT